MKLKDLQEQYRKALQASDEIRQKYDGNREDMTTLELERWEKAIDDADILKRQIEAVQKAEALEKFGKGVTDSVVVAGKEIEKKVDDSVLKSAFLKSLGVGMEPMTAEEVVALKAYQADNPGGGGYLVAPAIVSDQILTLMKDLVFMRNLATVFPMPTAESLGVVAMDTDPSDADWTNELNIGSEESTAALSRRQLKPNPVGKLLKLSETLLRKVANAETLWMDRLAYKMAITEEKAFLTGTGANQPLGVFTADAQGVSTGRDITAASTTTFTADEVINTVMNLKSQYRRRAEWIMHRDVLKACRKLKDSNNNYIWSTGLGPGNGMQGVPQLLWGLPVNESEYAPNTFTAALYMMVVADFSYFGIADSLELQIKVLDQLYAATNQIGYRLRKETDGMPLLEEAFSRLILHA